MSSFTLKPANLPEKLIWYYTIGTYGFYYIGAQYPAAAILAFIFLLCWWRQWRNQGISDLEAEPIKLPTSIWLWFVAVIIVEITIIYTHLDADLSIKRIIRASIDWYRSWGLLALFPLAGYLPIRPQIVYRVVCILGLQNLLAVPIAFIAFSGNITELAYTSPLAILGGDPKIYEVNWLGVVLDHYETRLVLFAPWPPALGLMGNLHFILACQESNRTWRLIGMAGAIAIIVASFSRLAIICLPIVFLTSWLSFNIGSIRVQLGLGLGSLLMGLLAPTAIEIVEDSIAQFNSLRAGSSRVRFGLARMTLDRWWNHAPIFGHGFSEGRGPASLGFMPLGSHHTWLGLLYVHGAVGCVAVASAFFWSLWEMWLRAKNSPMARMGLQILLVFLVFSMAENLEGLAYLCWLGWLSVGIALRSSEIQSTPEPIPKTNLSLN